MHYAVGYPLLGALGDKITPNDPFLLVSYAILVASAVLCFFAVKHLFGKWWAVLFSGFLFFWEDAHDFHYASELFVVPWNNQVLFLAFAFFFWLFATRLDRPTTGLIVTAGFVSGLSFLARPETILFVGLATAAYLFFSKARWHKWIFAFGIIGLCFVLQIFVKSQVLGAVSDPGRKVSYTELLSNYFQPSQLYNNTLVTIVDSFYFGETVDRNALFQESPWLWLSPLGFGFILFSRRHPRGLKIFMPLSLVPLAFYLSGPNMSAHKLAFHCLRYISASFIILNLAVIVVFRETLLYGGKMRRSIKS